MLTPIPNSIPTDGSTIYVFVDGVKVGHPIYNLASPAIAKLFPGYANSDRARSYFDLYTAGYGEGLQGYLIINNQLRPLPIGSTLDTKAGKFYWSPSPGYFGRYKLVFVIKDADNRYYKKEIEIDIEPITVGKNTGQAKKTKL